MTKYLSKMHLRSNHDKKISEQKKNIKQKTKQKKIQERSQNKESLYVQPFQSKVHCNIICKGLDLRVKEDTSGFFER